MAMHKRVSLLLMAACCCLAAGMRVAAGAGKTLFDVQDKLAADAQLQGAMEDLQSGFHKWKAAYSIKYASQDDEVAAFALWSERVIMMTEHNAKPNITFFMKMHERMAVDYAAQARPGARMLQQRKSLFTGLVKPPLALQSSPFRSLSLKDTSCPSTLNWVDQGALTPVKHQGSCGSCWTFSATGAIEAAVAIATGKLPTLSEQQLVDCVTGSNGCNGGWMGTAFAYIINAGGITTESTYPYKAAQGECQASVASGDVAAQVAGYTDLPAGDENALMMAVCNQPVSIALSGGSSAFQGYGGGVIEAGTDCDSSQVDHAVLAVGFGEDAGGKYWIVRNSWGSSWGESGHVRIRMGSNVCQVVSYGPTLPQVAGSGVPDDNGGGDKDNNGGCTSTYTIKAGDTLFNVAVANGVSLQQIISANPQITNPDLVQVGDTINIPCTQSIRASPLTCKAQYKVQAGESFFSIASKQKVTPQALQNANPQVANPDLIFPGTILNLPPCTVKSTFTNSTAARAQCKKQQYKVKAGDFLYKVASKFSCTVGDLLALNPSVAKKGLRPATTITVLSCPPAARASSSFLRPVHLKVPA